MQNHRHVVYFQGCCINSLRICFVYRFHDKQSKIIYFHTLNTRSCSVPWFHWYSKVFGKLVDKVKTPVSSLCKFVAMFPTIQNVSKKCTSVNI